VQSSIKNKDFFIRYYENKHHVYLHHNQANDDILNKFYSDDVTQIQKVAQVPSTNELAISLLPHYKTMLQSLYHTELYASTSDFFMYGPGHYMDTHADGSDSRICTTVLYLNDMTENDIGGETLFYDLHDETKIIYKNKPQKGDVIVFDSSLIDNIGLKHSVTKIQNWDRYAHRIYWKNTKEK
jgi:Rps23 Pro-64 3,4-dihydroxylase Tpa1-like proline 4-hydroxylase